MLPVSARTARSCAPGRCVPHGKGSNTAVMERTWFSHRCANSRRHTAAFQKPACAACANRGCGQTLPTLTHRDHTILFQGRKSAQRAHAVALEKLIELCPVGAEPRAIGVLVPQMQDTRCEAAVLAPNAGADHADNDIGILQTPADE